MFEKDEELFKAWKSEQYKDQSTEEKMEFVEHLHTFPKYFETTFLAGLKAGRPQWHKVADGDLPKEEDLVLFKTDVDYYIGKIDYSKKCWWTGVCRDESICNSFVIAWCEIPTFDKE